MEPPGAAAVGPAPALMPPLAPGPQGDPQGLGPAAGFGQPPGPMYPVPGPNGAPRWQPAPAGTTTGGGPGTAPHVWTRLEYLLWFNKDQPNGFPLLTTSAPNDQGLVGRASTLVLAGGGDIDYGTLSGFRITSGFYGDADRRYGFEASGFLLPETSSKVDIATSPSGIPLLARPYVNSAAPGVPAAVLVAAPNFAAGRALVDFSTSTWGVEANGLVNLFRSEPGCRTLWSIDAFAGYRFLELDEQLYVQTQSRINVPDLQVPIFAVGPFGILTQIGTRTVPVPVPVAGLTVSNPALVQVTDRLTVFNRFNGGNVGLRAEVRRGMWSVTATGKIAVGNMESRVDVDGRTEFVDRARGTAGGAFGGLFANAGTIGSYSTDTFAVIPEGTINVGIALTRSLTGFIGYNYLYVSDVVRPGSLVGPTVNTATVPFNVNTNTIPFSSTYGAAGRPPGNRVILTHEEYWLHGINFGMQLRY